MNGKVGEICRPPAANFTSIVPSFGNIVYIHVLGTAMGVSRSRNCNGCYIHVLGTAVRMYRPILGMYRPILGMYQPILGMYQPILGMYQPILGMYRPILGMYRPILDVFQRVFWRRGVKASPVTR